VLYVPEPDTGWEELAAAARAAGPEDGIVAIADALAARELEAPAFVYLTWRPRVAVLVFGDVELRTDQRAVPMLSGAGSQTWVEHSVPAVAGPVTAYVTPPEDADTDLLEGTVPAGGFQLRIDVEAAAHVRPEQPIVPPANEDAPTLTLRETAVSPAPDATPSSPAPDAPPTAPAPAAPAAAAPPAPAAPEEAVPEVDWRPPGVDPGDPQASLTAIQAAAVPDETAAPAVGAWTPPATRETPPAAAEPTPAAADTPPLVEAVHCPDGHANPPGRETCRTCGSPVAADAARRTVPQPPLGTLELDDGTVVELASDLVLGRRPTADGGARAVTVEGDRVSRSHAEVSLHRWEVRLRDLGSRNGTYIVAPGSSELVRVEPEVPVRLEPGMTVYLGTRSFVIRTDG
jgi:hypothetical protein